MASHFHVPETIEDALRIRRELGGAACFIAGGTEVNNRKAKAAPEHLVWLGQLGLGGISLRGAGVSIGAMATLQEILESEIVHPPIHQAASNHANRNIRNVATIGGHLGVCRSCTDLIPVLLTLGARLRVATDSGELERDLESWVLGRARRHRALSRGARRAGRPARRTREPQPHGQRPVPDHRRRVVPPPGGWRARYDRGGWRRGPICGPAAARGGGAQRPAAPFARRDRGAGQGRG